MNDVGNHYWRICRGNKSWRLSPPLLSGDRVCDAPILKDWQCFCCGIGLSRPLALHGSRGLSDLVCIMSHSDRSLWCRLRSSSGEPKLPHLRFFCFFCRRGQHNSSRMLSYGRARQDHRGLVATAFCDCAAFARSTGIVGVSGETWSHRAWASSGLGLSWSSRACTALKALPAASAGLNKGLSYRWQCSETCPASVNHLMTLRFATGQPT